MSLRVTVDVLHGAGGLLPPLIARASPAPFCILATRSVDAVYGADDPSLGVPQAERWWGGGGCNLYKALHVPTAMPTMRGFFSPDAVLGTDRPAYL